MWASSCCKASWVIKGIERIGRFGRRGEIPRRFFIVWNFLSRENVYALISNSMTKTQHRVYLKLSEAACEVSRQYLAGNKNNYYKSMT
jgi:hypothetical protein